MASKVLKGRGNTHLYLILGAVRAFAAADRVAEVKTGPFDTSAGEIDVTNWDSGNWKEVVPDIKSGSITVETNLVIDSTQVPALWTAYNSGAPVYYLLVFGDRPAAGAKNIAFSGPARLMKFKADPGDVHKLGFDLVIDGAPKFDSTLVTFPDLTPVP